MTGWQHDTEERQALADMAAEFTRRAIVPHLQAWEDAGEVPRELHREAGALGLIGVGFAEEVGGLGDVLDTVAVQESMLAAGASSGLMATLFTAGIAVPHIAASGDPDLIERFVRPTLAGEKIGSLAITEPGGGSDVAALRTTAVRDGDHYVVNGQKTWTTLGQYGDWIFTLVRTDPDAPKKQMGISFLLIDMKTEGLTVRPIELIDGGHEVNEVFFDNVRVPVENLVGEENKGWTYAKFLLGNERVGIARVGDSQLHLASAKKKAKEQGVFEQYASRIADIENQLTALELTALRVAAGSAGDKPHPASSVLKIKGSQLTQAVSDLLVDLEGPAAITSRDTRVFLNNRKVSIYGGSNEIQRQIIAGTILGL